MNEDFADILNKFSTILKEKNIDLNNIIDNKNMISNIESQTNEQDQNEETYCNNTSNDYDFNLDLETILKIKNILGKLNKNIHCPRNNLLFALKPYLEDEKKEKLEQYIKIANLLSVLEDFDSNMKINFSQNNYDFMLILTLFLLLF